MTPDLAAALRDALACKARLYAAEQRLWEMEHNGCPAASLSYQRAKVADLRTNYRAAKAVYRAAY